ncbi:MAG: acyltransferase [Bacteroidia bacterium]
MKERTALRSTIHSLDWLRGLASVMVCLFHVKKYVYETESPNFFLRACMEGYLGVYIFFVISGFVIPYSMFTNNYQTKNFFKYLLKRTIRIEPPYIIFIGLLFLWNLFLFHWKDWGSPYLFSFSDFTLNVTYLVPFFKKRWILVIFWTLAVEFQFYILTGLVFEWYMKNKWVRYAAIVLFILLGKIIPASYQTVFNNYAYFAIGFQAFMYFTRNISLPEFLITVVLLLTYIGCFEFIIVIPFLIITLLAIFFLNIKTKISSFFGKISYSLYLTHGLAGGAVAVFTVVRIPDHWRMILAIFTSIVFAFIYYLLVEKWFLKWSKRVRYD